MVRCHPAESGSGCTFWKPDDFLEVALSLDAFLKHPEFCGGS